jgi:hypothetical protein
MGQKCEFCGSPTTERFCSVGCRDEYNDDVNMYGPNYDGPPDDIDDDVFMDEEEEEYFDPDGDSEPADLDSDFGYDPYADGPEQDEPIDIYDSGDDLPW